jgi:peptide/nickel transport system substrate-binding protein
MFQGFARTGTGAVATRPAADGGSDGSVTVTPLARWRRYVRCSVGAAVVLAGLVLSACGGGTADHAAGQLRSLRSFTVAISTQPTTLDWVSPSAGSALPVLGLIYDHLEASGARCKLIPQVATSISYPNSTTLVFHLRKGVRFSNGDPLTAEDVAWSMRRTYGPGSALQGSLPTYKSISIIGPQEVALHLTKPTPAVACSTSFPFYVASKKYVLRHGKDYGTSAAPPITTGPYKVAKLDADGVTLVRNPYYWGPKPPIQTIRFVAIADDNTAQLAMRSNQIQADYAIGNPQTLGAWKAIPGARVFVAYGATSNFLTMDVMKAPFNDIHVRKAVAYAVDKKGLANSVAPGYATPLKAFTIAYGFESVAPSHEAAEQFIDTLPQYDFDLEKAKAELAKSAYPHGFTIRLPYLAGNSTSELTALNLKQNLQSIGITVQLKSFPAAQFYTESGMSSAHPGIQIITGWTVSPEDPLGGVAFMFGKSWSSMERAKLGGGANLANFFSPDLDRAQDQVVNQVGSARWTGVQTALRAIATQVPYVPVMNLPQLVVLGDGLSFNGPLNYMDMVSYPWIYKLR